MDKHSLNNCSEIKKLFNLFPWHWREGLRVVDINKLTEIRIRVGQPIILQLSMEKFYLGKNGLSNEVNDLIYPTQKEIEEIVFLVCNKSIYAYLPELLNGFLHYESGIRIGVCGEPVWNNEKIVKSCFFYSLNT